MTHETKKAGAGGPEVVFALDKPKPGQDDALRRLIAGHLPVLRRLELTTDRPALLRAKDGTLSL